MATGKEKLALPTVRGMDNMNKKVGCVLICKFSPGCGIEMTIRASRSGEAKPQTVNGEQWRAD